MSAKSKTLVNRARLEMDIRLDRVNKAVVGFFENEMSGSFLGLPQPARDHLDKFRSFLKAFYTHKYESWPPSDFEEEAVQQDLYSTVFSDFQNLYQHLVDPESSADMAENDLSQTGGVCTLQNIQAFDKKYSYEPLFQPLPRLPEAFDPATAPQSKLQRRMSWNLKQKRRALQEARKAHDKHALITASNRDVLVMDCPLVREYSDFEETTVDDDLAGLTAIEGRKVRWILIYAVLQTFHSISQPPKEVRNTSHLSYSLSCHPPQQKPWQERQLTEIRTAEKKLSDLAPDICYSHTNTSSLSLGETISRGRSAKARRRTLPANLPTSLVTALSSKTPPGSRSASLRRLVSSTRIRIPAEEMPSKRPSFREIYVEGYGNGLNQVARDQAEKEVIELTAEPIVMDFAIKEEVAEPHELRGDIVHEMATNETESPAPLPSSDGSTDTPPPMSRESSSSSISDVSSRSLEDDDDMDGDAPSARRVLTLVEILQSTCASDQPRGRGGHRGDKTSIQRPQSYIDSKAVGMKLMATGGFNPDIEPPYIHFNTLTWDKMLEQRPMTAPAAAVGA